MERVAGGIFIEAALCRSHVHIPAANFSRSSKHSSTLNLKTLPSFGGEDCGTLQERRSMHFHPKTSRAVAEPGHCWRTGENDISAVVGLEQRETDHARTTCPDPVGTRRSSESHPAWPERGQPWISAAGSGCFSSVVPLRGR